MHVITITSSFASSLYMLFAFGIKEISNWRELCLDFFSIPKSSICIFLCILSIFFLTVLYIDIANDMITKVINNNHILNFSIFHHLLENFLIKILAFCHSSIGISSGHIIPINQSCLNSIVLIHVLQTNSFADRGLIMYSLATIPIPASPHLIEKWTVNFIHFSPIDLGKTVSHLQIIIDAIVLFQTNSMDVNFLQSFNLVIVDLSMKSVIILSVILVLRACTFVLDDQLTHKKGKPLQQKANVGDELKYNGKGFGLDLQNVLNQAITDAAIFYKQNIYSQANYINTQMKKAKKGIWHIIIFQNLNISKITEVSTGFYYWSDVDTWALWYNASSFTQGLLHLAIYNGVGQKKVNNATTNQTAQGNIPSELSEVIQSIVKSLTTVQDISKYIQKFDEEGRKWSVISIPTFWGNKYPEAYSALSADGLYLSYNNYTKISGKDSSLIIYV